MFDKYKGMTFAQASERIAKKYPKRDMDTEQAKAFQLEIGRLRQLQEERRAQVEAEKVMANGGPITPVQAESTAVKTTLPMIDTWQPMEVTPKKELSRLTQWLRPEAQASMDELVEMQNSIASDYNKRIADEGRIGKPRLFEVGKGPRFGKGGKLYGPGGAIDPLETLPLMPVHSNSPSALDNPTLPKIQMNPSPDPKQRFADTKVGGYLADNIYAPVAVGKGLEFAAKAFQLADGYDQVDPELNPNASRIQRMMADRNINMDAVRNDALSGYNQGIEQAGNVRSQAVRQALGQQGANNLTRTMSQVGLQEQQANNQYRAEEAQTLNNLGAQEVQARTYAEQLNNQSKLGHQQSLQNLFTSVGNAGQSLTNFRAGVAQQQLVASMLSTDTFKFGNAQNILRKAWTNGELSVDDMIKIKGAHDNGANENMLLEMITELKQKQDGNS